jgi:hypothetical protein
MIRPLGVPSTRGLLRLALDDDEPARVRPIGLGPLDPFDDDDAAACPDPATLPDVCGLCRGDGVVRVPDESTVFPVVATCACVWDESDDVFPFDR